MIWGRCELLNEIAHFTPNYKATRLSGGSKLMKPSRKLILTTTLNKTTFIST